VTQSAAAHVVVAAYSALDQDDQDAVFAQIRETRLEAAISEETDFARHLASMVRARDHAGRSPTIDDYRAAYKDLKGTTDEIEEPSRLVRFFTTWNNAKEALQLEETEHPGEAARRFRSRRRLGKTWRYTEPVLRETLELCAEQFGRPPSVA
jgi:hypothetical protein